MYLPKHRRADDAEAAMLLSGLRAADLVSATADGPYATFLPLLHDIDGVIAGLRERGDDESADAMSRARRR
jgi:hypothetical protein